MSKINNRKFSRRTFIKASMATGASIAIAGAVDLKNAGAASYGENKPDPLDSSVQTIRTYCMMCNSACGIQVKVKDGVALKIDGNPYCPQTNDYSSAGTEVALGDISNPDNKPSRICAKGQAGLKTLYDTNRLTTPLKRVGPRGSGKWVSVSWKQAIDEIVNGGVLPNQSGAGEYTFNGLKEIRSLSPMDLSDTNFPAEAPGGNPANFGPKSNQFIIATGRDQSGGTIDRFKRSFGTTNYISHESLCNAAFKIAGEDTYGTYTLSPDIQSRSKSNYLLIFGSAPLEARVPFMAWARWLMDAEAAGSTVVVTDVRMSALAAQGRKKTTWVPIKPGTDGALAFAIMQVWMSSGNVKSDYLSRPNQLAVDKMAEGAGLRSYTNAAHLVWRSGPHKNKMVKTSHLSVGYGLTLTEKSVVCTAITPLTIQVYDVPASPVVLEPGDLSLVLADGSTAIAKTSYSILKDEVYSKDLATWSSICGVPVTNITGIANAFATASRPCADFYRGAMAHTNGYYTARAIHMLNVLMDRLNKIGGYGTAPSYSTGPVPIYPAEPTIPAAPNNVRIDRNQAYSGTVGTPTRMWYSRAKKGVQQEVYPSIKKGYPYKAKALFLYTSNPVYSHPFGFGAAKTVEENIKDTTALPLAISVSIFMDETAAICDYVLPDTTFLERFGNQNSGYACLLTKARNIRRPVVGAYKDITFTSIAGSRKARVYIPKGSTLSVDVFGNESSTEADSADAFLAAWTGPMLVDDILISIGKKAGLPGYGYNGFALGDHYDTAYRYHDRLLRGEVGGGLGLAGEGNSGVPGDGLSDCLKMGGRRENPGQVSDSLKTAWLKNRLITEIKLYNETTGLCFNPYTGTNFRGAPTWSEDCLSLKGKPHVDSGYSYRLVTYKMAWHAQSRTSSNQWLKELLPEGWIRINTTDASALNVKTGDQIKITSPTNGTGTTGKVFVTQTVAPGVVVVDHHFGRKWFGSQSYQVDGVAQTYDPSIGVGPASSPVSRADMEFGDMCLTDPLSGMAGYNSSKVKIEKVL